jgi:hypothetical protein
MIGPVMVMMSLMDAEPNSASPENLTAIMSSSRVPTSRIMDGYPDGRATGAVSV